MALHTPGHTPGSMSFWFPQDKLLIAGDTLFRRGIGRTDLWAEIIARLNNPSVRDSIASMKMRLSLPAMDRRRASEMRFARIRFIRG
ncbi:MBL fold metallo-hydrolase [Halopseudomonas pachastrellae]|nr:MBL fold metallo-hydrolase [Halopseudomonas pachastrellae]